jgi:hypothetical protein
MNKPKAFILLVALLSFSFMQCEKGDGNEPNNPYTGEWELLSISGGFAGNGYPADFPFYISAEMLPTGLGIAAIK